MQRPVQLTLERAPGRWASGAFDLASPGTASHSGPLSDDPEAGKGADLAGSTIRMLIVEDDFLVASLSQDALVEAGYEVVGIAADAEEAVAMALAEQPQLVLMDVRLDGPRDGIDAALELFVSHGLRCIMATAHSDLAVRARAEAARPLAWLLKPYTMGALVALVRQVAGDPHRRH